MTIPHADSTKTDGGLEVLIDTGLDTVNLEGKHFSPRVEQAQRVTEGQPVAAVHPDALVLAGYNPMTVMIVTNAAEYGTVVAVAEGSLRAEDLVLEVASLSS